MRRRYFLGWKEGQIGNLIMGEMGIKSKSADQDGSTWTAPPDIFDPFAFPSIASRPIRSFPRSASNATQRRSKTFPRDARCGWMPPPHPTASILFAVLCLLFFRLIMCFPCCSEVPFEYTVQHGRLHLLDVLHQPNPWLDL